MEERVGFEEIGEMVGWWLVVVVGWRGRRRCVVVRSVGSGRRVEDMESRNGRVVLDRNVE